MYRIVDDLQILFSLEEKETSINMIVSKTVVSNEKAYEGDESGETNKMGSHSLDEFYDGLVCTCRRKLKNSSG